MWLVGFHGGCLLLWDLMGFGRTAQLVGFHWGCLPLWDLMSVARPAPPPSRPFRPSVARPLALPLVHVLFCLCFADGAAMLRGVRCTWQLKHRTIAVWVAMIHKIISCLTSTKCKIIRKRSSEYCACRSRFFSGMVQAESARTCENLLLSGCENLTVPSRAKREYQRQSRYRLLRFRSTNYRSS